MIVSKTISANVFSPDRSAVTVPSPPHRGQRTCFISGPTRSNPSPLHTGHVTNSSIVQSSQNESVRVERPLGRPSQLSGGAEGSRSLILPTRCVRVASLSCGQVRAQLPAYSRNSSWWMMSRVACPFRGGQQKSPALCSRRGRCVRRDSRRRPEAVDSAPVSTLQIVSHSYAAGLQ